MRARPTMLRFRTDRLTAGMGCLWMLVVLTPAVGQAASVLVPETPSGFTTPLPGAPGGIASGPSRYDPGSSDLGDFLLEGSKFNASLSGIYNSNVAPTQNTGDDTAQDDFILSLGGSVNYLSKASSFTFGGNYHGNYNQYFNHEDYSGYSQGGALLANYDGGRLTATASVGMSVQQGSNSNYSSAFVQQTILHSTLTARYQFSRKTSLQGTFTQYATTADGGYSDTSSYTMGLSALWKYSPLTEIGPGVRYTFRTGSTQIDRTTIGPTVTLNYKLSKKVALTSRIGMDFASYSDGTQADPTLSANIGLNYRASKLWSMNLSLYRDTQADTTVPGAFSEITSLRLGYQRRIRQATWNVGTSYQLNSTVMPGNTSGSDRPDQKYFTIDTSLGMPVFSNTAYASVFVQFTDQRGGSYNTWSSVQGGLSISRSF